MENQKMSEQKIVGGYNIFSRDTCISFLNELLERPDILMDAMENENTSHDAESLWKLAEECYNERFPVSDL